MSGNTVMVPQGDSSSNAPAPQSQGESANALSGGQDWGEALAQQQAILSEQNQALTQQGQLVTSLKSELEKRNAEWQRLQKAISGEPEKKPLPHEERSNRLSSLVSLLKKDAEASLRQGFNGMPHTVSIGNELAQFAQEADARALATERELSQLKERLDRQQNPMFAGLERAAHFMEGMVEEGLEGLYGKSKETHRVRSAQYDSVTRLINDEIKDLIEQKDWEAIKKIQRSPKVMRNMVNHFIKEVVPPKVREMMEAEELASQPDDPSELLGAFQEAKQKYNAAITADDQRQADFWSQIMDETRQKFLAAQYGGKRASGQNGKPSINSLLSSYVGGGVPRG